MTTALEMSCDKCECDKERLTDGLTLQESNPVQLLPLRGPEVVQHVVDDALALLAGQETALLRHSLKALLVLQHKLLHTPAKLALQGLADCQLFCTLQ